MGISVRETVEMGMVTRNKEWTVLLLIWRLMNGKLRVMKGSWGGTNRPRPQGKHKKVNHQSLQRSCDAAEKKNP